MLDRLDIAAGVYDWYLCCALFSVLVVFWVTQALQVVCCCATSYSSLIGSGQSGEVEEIISLRQHDCIKVNTALPNIFLKICHSLLCVFMASSTNHCDRLLCLSTKAPYFLLPLPSFSLCSPPFLPHSCPFPHFHPVHHLFCLIRALSFLFALFATFLPHFCPHSPFQPLPIFQSAVSSNDGLSPNKILFNKLWIFLGLPKISFLTK